jgi:hypothetical protein
METMYKNETASSSQMQTVNKQEDTDTVKINLLDVTNGSYYLSEMGKVYNAVKVPLAQNKKVVLSFGGMKDVTPGQLSLSVGKLYDDFLPEKIEQLLQMTDYPWNRDTDIDLVYKMGRLYRYDKPEFDRRIKRSHEIANGNY